MQRALYRQDTRDTQKEKEKQKEREKERETIEKLLKKKKKKKSRESVRKEQYISVKREIDSNNTDSKRYTCKYICTMYVNRKKKIIKNTYIYMCIYIHIYIRIQKNFLRVCFCTLT